MTSELFARALAELAEPVPPPRLGVDELLRRGKRRRRRRRLSAGVAVLGVASVAAAATALLAAGMPGGHRAAAPTAVADCGPRALRVLVNNADVLVTNTGTAACRLDGSPISLSDESAGNRVRWPHRSPLTLARGDTFELPFHVTAAGSCAPMPLPHYAFSDVVVAVNGYAVSVRQPAWPGSNCPFRLVADTPHVLRHGSPQPCVGADFAATTRDVSGTLPSIVLTKTTPGRCQPGDGPIVGLLDAKNRLAQLVPQEQPLPRPPAPIPRGERLVVAVHPAAPSCGGIVMDSPGADVNAAWTRYLVGLPSGDMITLPLTPTVQAAVCPPYAPDLAWRTQPPG